MIRLILFVVLPFLVVAQNSNWNSVVDLNLATGSEDQIDIYTDSDGNHILVGDGSSLTYYLYSPSGTQVRSHTFESSLSSAVYNKIVGHDNTVYVSYRKGSTIYTEKSTDAGQNWSSLNNISLSTSDSDGLELWADDAGLHIVYSLKASGNYESYYKLSEHGEADWINDKTVTDESGVTGGTPSVTTSSDRVHVAFSVWGGDLKTRDKYNSSWQSSQGISINDNYTPVAIASSQKLHLFYCEDNFPYVKLLYKNRSLSGSTWSGSSELSADTDWIEDGKADVAVTADDRVHVVYKYDALDSYYREWDGSMSNYFDFTPSGSDGGYAQRISANGNDIYTLWIAEDGASGYELKLRQRDYAPLKPVGVDAEESANNHPLISWDASEAADLDEYEVWKKDGSWSQLATTTNTSYEDVTEDVYQSGGGGEKGLVFYKVRAVDDQANQSAFSSDVQIAVDVEEEGPTLVFLDGANGLSAQVSSFELYGSYPNPFNPSTQIVYALPEAADVELAVYDLKGSKIVTLTEGSLESGWHKASFDGRTLPSGIYIYRLTATGTESGKHFTQAKRMLLVK